MTRLVPALALLWLLLSAAGYLAARATEPTGDGFTRGFNRLELFFAFKLAGFVVAVVAMALTQRGAVRLPKGVRVVGRIPLVVDLVSVAGLIALVLYLRIQS